MCCSDPGRWTLHKVVGPRIAVWKAEATYLIALALLAQPIYIATPRKKRYSGEVQPEGQLKGPFVSFAE